MPDFFILDGVRSDDKGIVLQSPVSFAAPVPRVSTVSVPGRNGDLHFFDGSFENVAGEAKAFVLQEQAAAAVSAINRWALAPGYKRFQSSDDLTVYRMARIVSGAETAVRARLLAPFTFQLDAMPQKFLVSGDYSTTLAAPMAINNPGAGGKPLLTVSGAGPGALTVNGYKIIIKALTVPLSIDCDTQNAYAGMLNKNMDIACDDFPRLSHGANAISWTGGIKTVSIKPRWYDL